MVVKLAVSVGGRRSDMFSSSWHKLQVKLGLANVEDTAELTLSAQVSSIELPPRSARISFAANGADLGRFEIGSIGGDTQAGTLTIHCAAVNAESNLRKPRDRSWRGQTLASIIGTIAADAGLVPAVEPAIGRRVLAARVQIAESDLAFARRLAANLGGRLLIQEGRLIVTSGDGVQVSPLPPLRVDLRTEGSWARWRRGWRDRVGRVRAAYLLEDGVTADVVELGGTDYPTTRTLPTTFPSREAAEAAARAFLSRSDTSADSLELITAFTPGAQVLQPVEIAGGADRIPAGFGGLVAHQIQHALGSKAATTTITAAPGV